MKDAVDKSTGVIPKGPYCYDDKGLCPYWSEDLSRHEQENGYCSYLERGDWEMNDDKKWRVAYVKDGEANHELQSGHDLGIPMSLLWDQCKECGINDDWEDEDGRD